MRPLRTTLRNIGRFQAIELVLQDIPDTARIVAFDGDPGSGKSTLFRALTCGALFRKFRNSGTLANIANGNAMLETVIEHGGEIYTAKHLIEGKNGVSQLTKNGEAAHDKAKRRDFKAAAEATFPSELLLTNTVWRDQKSLGFLELDQSQRRDLIMMATGATKWQEWWTITSERANTEEKEAAALRSKVEALQQHAESLGTYENLSAALGAAKLAIHSSAKSVIEADEKLAARQREVDAYEHRMQNYNVALNEVRKFDQGVVKRHQEIADAKRNLESTTELLSQAEQINFADTAYKHNDAIIEELREQHQKDTLEISRLEFMLRELLTQKEQLIERLVTDTATLNMLSEVQEAEKAMNGLVTLICEQDELITRYEYELEQMRIRLLNAKDTRIRNLREALAGVLLRHLAKEDIEAALKSDDDLSAEEFALPSHIKHTEERIVVGRKTIDRLRNELREASALAARRKDIDSAQVSLMQCEGLLRDNERARGHISNQLNHLKQRDTENTVRTGELSKANAALEPDAKRVPELIRAETQADYHMLRIAELENALADYLLIKPEEPSCPEAVAPISQSEIAALIAARLDHSNAAKEQARLEERINSLYRLQQQLDDLNAQLKERSVEASDWLKLTKLIGRDGIQSALIDAAGPRLSETVNYFLHTCFGNRWTQSISTQRTSSDGKKTIEQCQVNVIDNGSEEDNAPAREGEGITFSGGEQEILSLAFQLALTHLARDCGIINPDIFLDEPASALSESMRSKWVHMLRVAADLIGCKHVYVITHNEDVKRLADARIKLERGIARFVQGET